MLEVGVKILPLLTHMNVILGVKILHLLCICSAYACESYIGSGRQNSAFALHLLCIYSAFAYRLRFINIAAGDPGLQCMHILAPVVR